MKNRYKNKGFTIIEIIVVLAIVSVLTTLSLIYAGDVRKKGQEKSALADLKQIRTAIGLLDSFVSKGPAGCIPGTVADVEVLIDSEDAGINSITPVPINYGGCAWTAADIAKWTGPYINNPNIKDAWGRSYIYDADYQPYANCGTIPTGGIAPHLVSPGREITNANGIDDMDCDDIFLRL